MTAKEIEDLVYNHPTKNKHGFSSKEMEDLLSEIEGLDIRKYNEALTGITCMMDEEDGIIVYPVDVVNGIRAGLGVGYFWD